MKTVTVKAGAVATVDFTYTGDEKSSLDLPELRVEIASLVSTQRHEATKARE
jgi:hypothetical protein